LKNGSDLSSVKDYKVLVNNLVYFPTIFPFKLDYIVDQCIKVGCDEYFREYLLRKGLYVCPMLIHRLMDHGYYTFTDIEFWLKRIKAFGASILFFPTIGNEKEFKRFYIKKGEAEIKYYNLCFDELLAYGWEKDSLGFVLKYDTDSEMAHYDDFNELIEWSAFEWAYHFEQFRISPLDFAARFGSIRCFKYLILNKAKIQQETMEMACCSGNYELIQMTFFDGFDFHNAFWNAAKSWDNEIVEWFLNQNLKLNSFKSMNCISIIDRIIEKHHLKMNELLFSFAFDGYLELIQTFFKEEVDFNILNVYHWFLITFFSIFQ